MPGDTDPDGGRDGPPSDEGGDETDDLPRLLLDEMCGGIRGHLRMCGYDAAYAVERGHEGDDRILSAAREEDRVLITRDRELAARAEADPDCPDGLLLTARDAEGQLRRLADAGLPLELDDRPSRCGDCNGPVEPAAFGGEAGDDGAGADGVESDGEDGDDGGAGDGDDGGAGDGDDGGRPEHVPDDVEAVYRCVDCGQHFWRGSHWEAVAETLSEL